MDEAIGSGGVLARTGRYALLAAGIAILCVMVLPSILVVIMSFSASAYLEFPPQALSVRWYENFFQSAAWQSATRTSVISALLTTAVATPAGVAAAYAVAGMQGRNRKLVEYVFLVPIIFPHILIGIGIFFLFIRLKLNSTLLGLTLAHSVLAVPFVFLLVSSKLKEYDWSQERAAQSLGASRLHAFLTVVAPQIKYTIVTAAFLAFITSLDEVIVSLFISGGQRATLTKVMFVALRDQIDPTIAALSALLILVSVTLFSTIYLIGRSRQ